MNTKLFFRFFVLYLFFSIPFMADAQNLNRERRTEYLHPKVRRIINIPDIAGYKTLKGDFHIHTVFSDGYVWPSIRVEEAWREGLDIIAITDHIEYLPHKKYVEKDLNNSYALAKSKAAGNNILLIKGAEITKKMPPGHLNALFLDDANLVENEDAMLSIEQAIKQGAFIMWNHPGWDSQQKDTTLWWDFHTQILEKGWLHGIEVFNSQEWYPVALKWCIDKKLTVFANSDIHVPISHKYDLTLPNSHRPLTLVFAKDRTLESVKEAMFAGRTLGWFGDVMVGKEELLMEITKASLTISKPFRTIEKKEKTILSAEIQNPTDLTFYLQKKGNGNYTRTIEILPRTAKIITYSDKDKVLKYSVTNFYSNANQHPVVEFKITK